MEMLCNSLFGISTLCGTISPASPSVQKSGSQGLAGLRVRVPVQRVREAGEHHARLGTIREQLAHGVAQVLRARGEARLREARAVLADLPREYAQVATDAAGTAATVTERRTRDPVYLVSLCAP